MFGDDSQMEQMLEFFKDRFDIPLPGDIVEANGCSYQILDYMESRPFAFCINVEDAPEDFKEDEAFAFNVEALYIPEMAEFIEEFQENPDEMMEEMMESAGSILGDMLSGGDTV